MAQDLQVRLYTGAGVYLPLDVLGSWSFRQEPVYREIAGSSVELAELREIWTVDGFFVSSDGTHADGWDTFQAAKTQWEVSGSLQPLRVEVVRNPGASAVVELTLGPPDYEELRIESIDCSPWTEAPSASMRTIFPVSMVFSAVRKYATTNVNLTGIIAWEQTSSISYINGLREFTLETELTTKEGEDAEAKAQTYGAIPLSAIGGNYTITTSGPYGVDIDVLDTNDRLSRVPTQVRAVSTIREFGVSIGASAYGASPSLVSLESVISTTGTETTRVTRARAEGSGAETWCKQHKPTWAQDEETQEERGQRVYQITWSAREQANKRAIEEFWVLKGDISGGHQAIGWGPVTGLEPVMFTGPLQPWNLSLSVSVERRGGTGARSELPLPPVLSSPWVLDMVNSSEGEPYLLEAGTTSEGDRWARDASLTYWSATKPKTPPIKTLRDKKAQSVESYFLP